MKILVTGVAGFIGSHVALRLLARGDEVIGVDNLNAYYDPALKRARLARLAGSGGGYTDLRVDIADRRAFADVFGEFRPQRVVHLAAQAGVRYSIDNPHAYIDTNIVGFANVLEGCRHGRVEHLVYASSSSVYGANTKLPFAADDGTDHPLSLYGATKKANEVMAHSYSSLFRLPTTGLRFFTVYGPWGRPDMALFLFTKRILAGEPIDVFNHGKHTRGFTYIDDIVEGVVRVLDRVPQPIDDSAAMTPAASTRGPYRIYNIGSETATPLSSYIEEIERALGKKARLNLLPMQPGDVAESCADVQDLISDVGYQPTTPVRVGVENFVSWYRSYYNV